jgi:hypothetical protein
MQHIIAWQKPYLLQQMCAKTIFIATKQGCNYFPRLLVTIMLWQLIHIATVWPLLPQFSSVAKAQISSSASGGSGVAVPRSGAGACVCVIASGRAWRMHARRSVKCCSGARVRHGTVPGVARNHHVRGVGMSHRR